MREVMPDSRLSAERRTWALSVILFVACGAWLIALGAYFALLRPPLLPEDARFMGTTVGVIKSELPEMATWLRHVFTVMGGFMFAVGALTIALATSRAPARPMGTGAVLLAAGLATVVTMSWINFVIDSQFKWLLLAPAVVWCAGIAAYLFEGRMRHASQGAARPEAGG